MKLCRYQTRLLPHDCELLLETFQKLVDMFGGDEKRAHQHHWTDVMLELLGESDAIVQVDDLRLMSLVLSAVAASAGTNSSSDPRAAPTEAICR